MNVKISKLRNIAELGIYADLDDLLSAFKCSRNRDSEKFLRNTARRHDSKDISRTYLCVDTEGSKIVGYFTLAVKCISMDASKVADAETLESMNIDRGVAQAYLIGQLARADESPKGLGNLMMNASMDILAGIKDALGCHTVRVDCADELVGYYSEYGFVNIGKNPDRGLNHMVAVI
ncbi:MAG: hypothetical protein LBS92_03075 [Candidatus Methanoplasma sp.]|jgi:predicted GNAT family N-acyltransferase|nr:hypothetical protein [Candidatus Methanoplasma sp.]